MLKDREPLPKEYIDKDVRVEKIAQQGLSAVWLFPTLGVLYEELLKEDIDVELQDMIDKELYIREHRRPIGQSDLIINEWLLKKS